MLDTFIKSYWQGNYHVDEYADGFVLQTKHNKQEIFIYLSRSRHKWIISDKKDYTPYTSDHVSCGLLNYRAYLAHIANILRVNYKFSNEYGKRFKDKTKREKAEKAVSIKYKNKFKLFISKVVNDQYHRILNSNIIPNNLILLHRKIYSTTGPSNYNKALTDPICCNLLTKVLNFKFLKDYFKYNAAVITLLPNFQEVRYPGNCTINTWNTINSTSELGCKDYLDIPWRSHYIYHDNLISSYRALNKTLDHFPAGMPISVCAKINQVKLPKPLYSKLELISYIELMTNRYPAFPENPIDVKAKFEKIWNKSSFKEIKNAIKYWLERENRDYKTIGKTIDIQEYIHYLTDTPVDFNNISLKNLTKRAIQYHENLYANREFNLGFAPSNCKYDTDTKTKLPPIATPLNDNIRFLSTVGEIQKEQQLMHHCIGNYISDAVEGKCFLFHVEYEGEKASVEIMLDGTIRQISGPCNKKNKACDWAKLALLSWMSKSKIPAQMAC